MTLIRVTPEQLMEVSNKFEQARQSSDVIRNTLTEHMGIMERGWSGTTKERFYVDYMAARQRMELFTGLMSSISQELNRIAVKFRLTDEERMEPCYNPEVVDMRNPLEKSIDSFKEIGDDFVAANDVRYSKAFDSVYDFLNYMTYGLVGSYVEGTTERSSKKWNSTYDFMNYISSGALDTVGGALNPSDPWSKEHWLSSIGLASALAAPIKLKAASGSKVGIEAQPKVKVGDGKEEVGAGSNVQTGAREMSLKEFARQEAEASKMYDNIRASTTDVEVISRNTGITESRIQRIKDHVFNNEHIKSSGIGRFDPDYEIAQAWQRLQNGTHTKQDIDLLNHEIFESRFEGIFKTDYETAHSASEKSGRVWRP